MNNYIEPPKNFVQLFTEYDVSPDQLLQLGDADKVECIRQFIDCFRANSQNTMIYSRWLTTSQELSAERERCNWFKTAAVKGLSTDEYDTYPEYTEVIDQVLSLTEDNEYLKQREKEITAELNRTKIELSELREEVRNGNVDTRSYSEATSDDSFYF